MNLRRGSTAKYDFIQRKSSMETWGGGGGEWRAGQKP